MSTTSVGQVHRSLPKVACGEFVSGEDSATRPTLKQEEGFVSSSNMDAGVQW